MNEDPSRYAGRDANLYRYVRNIPTSLIDPFGLAAMSLEEIQDLVGWFNESGQSNALIICVMWKESGFDPAAKATGSTATGLMQITKGAAKDAGYEFGDLTDPAVNTEAGTKYLAKRISWAGGDVKKGLEGYGTGPGYADNIMECEKCLQKAESEECGDPKGCLDAIHK